MLTPADDYPLHQTPEPMAFAGTDRNFYDRFFFNGYHETEDIYFAVALGVYPQLNIMDASVCLFLDGVQYNLRTSKEMNMDRLALQVGPIRVEIAEPLERTIIHIDDNEHGLSGQIEARALHPAIEEPRFIRRNGPRVFMDYTRLTQNVSWSGTLTFKGRTIDMEGFQGSRDRSWGIRPIGKADPQPLAPPMDTQFYWLWMPTNFLDYALFCHTNDDAEGNPWNRRAVLFNMKTRTATHFDDVSLKTNYAPDTRRITSVALQMNDEQGQKIQVNVENTGFLFYMNGLGYTHPEWGHGMHHGALEVAFDEIDGTTAEEALRNGVIHNLHVQALSRVRLTLGGEVHEGRGIIEQFFIGPHKPSGFHDTVDRIMD